MQRRSILLAGAAAALPACSLAAPTRVALRLVKHVNDRTVTFHDVWMYPEARQTLLASPHRSHEWLLLLDEATGEYSGGWYIA